MLKKGVLTGLLGGVLWLAVMAGYDLYEAKSFAHTPKVMATLLMGVPRAEATAIGFPYILGLIEALLLFALLGIIFAGLTNLLPLEVSVVVGFLFGGAVAYFVFLKLFGMHPAAPLRQWSETAVTVSNLAVGILFGLRMHK